MIMNSQLFQKPYIQLNQSMNIKSVTKIQNHQQGLTYLKFTQILLVSLPLFAWKSEGKALFLSLSKALSFQLLFVTFTGLFPMYLLFISLRAFKKSLGSLNETNPQPLDLPILLSRTTLPIWKDLYLFLKTELRIQSVTQLPKLPTNIRQSFYGHQSRVLSFQTIPATFLSVTSDYFLSFFIFFVFWSPVCPSYQPYDYDYAPSLLG